MGFFDNLRRNIYEDLMESETYNAAKVTPTLKIEEARTRNDVKAYMREVADMNKNLDMWMDRNEITKEGRKVFDANAPLTSAEKKLGLDKKPMDIEKVDEVAEKFVGTVNDRLGIRNHLDRKKINYDALKEYAEKYDITKKSDFQAFVKAEGKEKVSEGIREIADKKRSEFVDKSFTELGKGEFIRQKSIKASEDAIDIVKKGKIGVAAGAALLGLTAASKIHQNNQSRRRAKRERRGNLYGNAPGIR